MKLFNSKKSAKKILFALFILFLSADLFSFDWPQMETASDSFYSYFGQLRGNTIESSLVFKDSSEVKSADKGFIVAIIKEHDNDFGWFESTLGNAVIVAHDNDLTTVYGNLDEETMPQNLYSSSSVSTGTSLGSSGNSGWQEGQSCLEFQVLDVKNKAAVNPRILMPRVGKELPLIISELTLDDRNGKTTYLDLNRRIKSGVYTVYYLRQTVAVPYRTTISINGAVVESISYDMLKEKSGKLCIENSVEGNAEEARSYSKESLYPDDKRQLLGQVRLSNGRNTLTVSVADILGERKTLSYTLDVY